jgi:hypothetical protein
MTKPYNWTRTILAGAAVGAALTIEHLLCYDADESIREPELTLLASNVLGTCTIAAGVMLAAPTAEEIARHLTIAAIGGAIVVGLRVARRTQRRSSTAHYLAGHGAGQIHGARTYGAAYNGAIRPHRRD